MPHDNRRDQEYIMITGQNRKTTILKVRMVFNVKPTRECLAREETSITTESLEAIF